MPLCDHGQWEVLPYRRTLARELALHIGPRPASPRFGLVFIHGGGWTSGCPTKVYGLGEALTVHGIQVVLPEYRRLQETEYGHAEATEDVAAAWAKARARLWAEHSPLLPVFFGGGSAGAHLALMAWFENEQCASAGPAGWVLANPVVDTSPAGFGHELCRDRWEDLSPLLRIDRLPVPVLAIQGTADTVTPPAGLRRFVEKLRANDTKVTVRWMEGAEHGAFNARAYREQSAAWIAGFMITHVGQPD